MKKIEVTQEEIEQRIFQMKSNITKGINNLIGYTYINPSTIHVFVKLYRKGAEFGFFDDNNKPQVIYTSLEPYKSGTRYFEAFNTKGFIKQYDEIGIEQLTDFFFDKQMAVLRKDLEELKIKENKKLTKDENK